MGNGAKAATRRERGAKDAKKGPTSQLKTNEAAKTIQCQTCKLTFMSNMTANQLELHAENKHGKKLADCFPGKVA